MLPRRPFSSPETVITRTLLLGPFPSFFAVIKASAISTLTNSGYTAFQISAWRPKSHVIAFSSERRILGKLNLLWGVRAFYYDRELNTDDTIKDLNEIIKEKGFVKPGEFVINLSSMPVDEKGMVNTLRVSQID